MIRPNYCGLIVGGIFFTGNLLLGLLDVFPLNVFISDSKKLRSTASVLLSDFDFPTS